MKKEKPVIKYVLNITLIIFFITLIFVLCAIGQTIMAFKEKMGAINIDDLTSVAKCDIQFKDIKYSGICNSDVIDAIKQYGQYELFIECANKFGLENCKAKMS